MRQVFFDIIYAFLAFFHILFYKFSFMGLLGLELLVLSAVGCYNTPVPIFNIICIYIWNAQFLERP